MNYSTRRQLTPEAALIRLEELCARSEQCVWELRRKLNSWKISPDNADDIIHSLVKRRFVDDNRYATAFARDKYRFAHWGRRKIGIALRQRHIGTDTINEALAGIDDEEYTEILHHLLARKIKTMTATTGYEAHAGLFRFAVARGFEPDIVSKAIAQLIR